MSDKFPPEDCPRSCCGSCIPPCCDCEALYECAYFGYKVMMGENSFCFSYCGCIHEDDDIPCEDCHFNQTLNLEDEESHSIGLQN